MVCCLYDKSRRTHQDFGHKELRKVHQKNSRTILWKFDMEMHDGFLQQYSATVHTLCQSLAVLRNVLGTKLLFVICACSFATSDLMWLLATIICGKSGRQHIGEHSTHASTHAQYKLKEIIRLPVSAICKQELQTEFNNLFTRRQACLKAEGGHFQHLL